MEAWIQQIPVNVPQGGLVHADSLMHSCPPIHINPKMFGWDMQGAIGGKEWSPSPNVFWSDGCHLAVSCRLCPFEEKEHTMTIKAHPDPVITVSLHKPGFTIYFFCSAVIQSWWSLTYILISSHFADWIGKRHRRQLPPPFQVTVKWYVLSKMSFCTSLFSQAVMWEVLPFTFDFSLPVILLWIFIFIDIMIFSVL